MSAPVEPGVHRVLGDPAPVLAQLRRTGWRIGELHSGRDTGVRALLTEIGRVLEFPDYYGRNLDALDECLADLPVPSVLVWSGWQGFAVSEPRVWAVLLELWTARAEHPPAFAVLLV
ncbi:barstar family protein [Naumannella sp. ID2617S]|uniref:Barstar n=1 Tax=Enemella dayhoffiae TaxID=2016507 RepID=A0A255HAL0_9ACTN|nr:barstar family protein [Enemella dayhoffiae]NNG18547.1 barstar family protein [Naumannella sp. ID2617S]OYO24635.1 barstar [Enemella dayhoffiae]